ncbi:MAG TPA: hypothetical protein DCM28_16975 [Phycisphaerales bacterium]|nr:hypothetical protein [Phycisphaerales bacterium]
MSWKIKSIWCWSLCLVAMQTVCASPLFAQEPAFVSLNFEDQVAGMNCQSPKRNWGSQGKDLVLIDNINTVKGDGNCMLLERPEGYKSSGWGVGMNLPQKQYDWLKIQVSFLLDGPATKATAGLELREHYNKRLYFASLGSAKGKDPITLIDGGSGWKTSKTNTFDRKVWNRVTWYVPSVTATDMTMHLQLETWDSKNKAWQVVGKIGSMEASKAEKPFASFRINFPGGEESIKLRFDDLLIEPMTNEQINLLIK